MSAILTVRQLNMYVKSLLETDKNLRPLTVIGEISGIKFYNSGHAYFTLKDSESAVSAVMFDRDAAGLKFMPKDGMKVYATGRVSLYEKTGQYQLYVSKMIPDGIGAEFLAFEQLKEKLEKEGLFATIEQGKFGGVKRARDGGKGLSGVCVKDESYFNPFIGLMLGGEK